MLPVNSTEQGLKRAAALPATGAPSIRSVKFVHLLINADTGCDRTSSGGGREGPWPDELRAWRLGQTIPSVMAEGRTGIHAQRPHILLERLPSVLCLKGKPAFTKQLAIPFGIYWSTQFSIYKCLSGTCPVNTSN